MSQMTTLPTTEIFLIFAIKKSLSVYLEKSDYSKFR